MSKINVINYCEECKYCNSLFSLHVFTCRLTNKILDSLWEIPEWCPLKDTEEND